MSTWADVRRIAKSLPETEESESFFQMSWKVQGKSFIWERPLRKSDLLALGSAAPKGEILGVRVESLLAKEKALKKSAKYCFTTPHFDGYPAILVQLDKIPLKRLEELVEQAWRCRAPKRLAESFPADRKAKALKKSKQRNSKLKNPRK